MISAPEPESHLLSIVEVSHANRIRCQADGCDHSVFKRIHVVLDNGKFHVLGSQCYATLYGGHADQDKAMFLRPNDNLTAAQ